MMISWTFCWTREYPEDPEEEEDELEVSKVARFVRNPKDIIVILLGSGVDSKRRVYISRGVSSVLVFVSLVLVLLGIVSSSSLWRVLLKLGKWVASFDA